MKIAIVGYGFVGRSTELLFFQPGVEILIHDPNLGRTISDWSGVDYTFICVPTPVDENGKCLSTTVVDEVVKFVRGKTTRAKRGGQIVVRSTLGPEQLNSEWIYMPEFLKERTWKEDTLSYHTPVVFGTTVDVSDLCILLPMKKVYVVTPQEAAVYKLSRNALLATKVMFANHLYDVCEKEECNFDSVIELYMGEGEFGYSHWNVPGPDGKRGFGGKCLPKDTTHFANLISDQNMFTQILEDNDITR